MKIFVTGATGFIGSHVVRKMLNAGHSVLGLASPRSSFERIHDIVDQIDLLVGRLGDFEFPEKDLMDWGPQICVHFAWYTQPGKYLHARDNISSLMGSINLLQTLMQNGCEHFIGAGTCAEYDIKDTPLFEKDPVGPQTLYASAKLSFKLIGEQIAHQFGGLFSWGRVFYLYGPFEDERRLVPSAMRAIHANREFPTTEGGQERDFLQVEDVANAFLKMAESSTGGTYNVSSGIPITIRVLLERLVQVMKGKPELLGFGKLPYSDWNPMHITGDNTALREIGWTPEYSLEDGLAQTLNWWLAQQEAGR